LLREPWTLATQSGTPFRVFTPFWRALRERGAPPSPLPAPNHLTAHAWPRGLARTTLDALELEPKNPDWAAPLRAVWRRGEAGAQAALRQFLEHGLRDYVEGRDRPHQEATSRMSPYLRFGHISPRQLWHAAPAADKFLSELGWREFSYYLLFHSPDLATRNWQPAYDAMAWRHDKPALRAWQRGQTGYPLVDAGMRQLWQTGWMHNRVRMVAASFLIKHLLLDWRLGEAWFWDTLVDADPASNPASWQWVAGSGADAAPYYRIFNPVLQGRKFDPAGAYVRRWVPELAALPAALIHEPWTAKPAALRAAGVRLGQTYPLPIVDHDAARARALTAWQATRALA
jgi:deoxyribodipyrimidine photo-lyase